MNKSSQVLSQREKIAYGIGDIGGCLFFTFMGLWVLHYFTDVVGMDTALAGTVIALGKLWDALMDPFVGYLSDRTKSSLGRRRSWMLAGIVPLMLSLYYLFTVPGFNDSRSLFIWALVLYCFLSTAFTCINIPYSALTPELTKDYHEQSSLNGYRFFCAGIGSLIAAGLTLPLVHIFANAAKGFQRVALIFAVIIALSTLVTILFTKEKGHPVELNLNFKETYSEVFSNKAFMILLAAYCANIIGLSIIMGIAVYYFKYIHGQEAYTTWAMLALLASSLVFIPVVVKVSKLIDKRLAYVLGLSFYAFSLFVIYLVGHKVTPFFSISVMVIAGIGQSFCYVLPFAMMPDTIHYNTKEGKQNQEGAYYGVWTFIAKAGQAFALLICGQMLALSNYQVDHAISSQALSMIRLLLGPVAIFFYVLSIGILTYYPLNAKVFVKKLA